MKMQNGENQECKRSASCTYTEEPIFYEPKTSKQNYKVEFNDGICLNEKNPKQYYVVVRGV